MPTVPTGFIDIPARARWWEQGWAIALLALLSAVPLLGPDFPPLIDLPGHMGRYRVQLGLAGSADLRRFYDFEWALIGNLGVDLLVVPLAPLLGLEGAVKAVAAAIPALTAAGFLLVAREAHGGVPPTAIFALPLAYGYPFMFGFVNFALSMALALLAFALWLRLGRTGATRLRAVLFVPISLAVWITHAFGWGTLGVLAFTAELVRRRDGGDGWIAAATRAGLAMLPLLGPALPMLLWRSGAVEGQTGRWFDFELKVQWIQMALRDRWAAFDVGAVNALLLLLILGVRGPLRFAPSLRLPAAVLVAVFLLLPWVVIGSAYADMRLAPYMLAVAVLALGMRPGGSRRAAHVVAGLALAFFAARTAGTAVSLWTAGRDHARLLAALDRLPRGAALLSFVGTRCDQPWALPRNHHLPALAIVRRDAFSNDQWAMAGAQLLRVRFPEAGRFGSDPSQIVTAEPCNPEWLSLDQSLRQLPRGAFDYVWLIDPPRHDARLLAGLRPVWRRGSSTLLRIER